MHMEFKVWHARELTNNKSINIIFVLCIWNSNFGIFHLKEIKENKISGFHPFILFYIFTFFFHNKYYLSKYEI